MCGGRRPAGIGVLPLLARITVAGLTAYPALNSSVDLDAGGIAADARAEAVRRFGDMAVVSAECRRFGRQRDRNRSRAEYLEELYPPPAGGLRRAQG